MFEISPVLAGTFDRPDYTPATTNINQPVDDTGATADIDPRRYSQFDRTASQVSDASMSFGDFLDMINPLQHIPVVSSVYRAITGDSIHPVSRIAGDILYGGAFGAATAVMSGISAIGDSVMEAETGKDVTGTVMASLFGDDAAPTNSDTTTQIASAETTIATATTALQTPPPPQAEKEPSVDADTPPKPAHLSANNDQTLTSGKLAPLVRNKLPYGGALAKLPNYHDENLKMAVSNATGGIRVGNTIYNNRFKNSLPPAVKDASTNTGTTAGHLPSTPVPPSATEQSMPLPSGLQDNAMMLKALEAYRSVAEGQSSATRN